MNRKNMLTLVTVMMLTAITGFSISLYLPAMPEISKSFQSTEASVQLSLSIFLLALGLSQLVFGGLSDVYGKRLIAFVSILFVFFGTGVLLFSQNMWVFWLGRLIQGVGCGGIAISSKSIIKKTFSNQELAKIISILMFTMALVPLVSPVIGSALIKHFEWRVIFIVLLLYILVVLFFFLPLSKPVQTDNHFSLSSIFNGYMKIFQCFDFIKLMLAMIFIYSLQAVYLMLMPFILTKQFNIAPSILGYYLAIPVAFEILGLLTSIYISKIFQPSKVALFGVCFSLFSSMCLLISILAFGLHASVLVLFVALNIYGGAIAYPSVLTKALQIANHSNSGKFSAAIGVLQQLGAGAVLLFLNLLHVSDSLSLSIIFCVLCVLGLLFVSLSKKSERELLG